MLWDTPIRGNPNNINNDNSNNEYYAALGNKALNKLCLQNNFLLKQFSFNEYNIFLCGQYHDNVVLLNFPNLLAVFPISRLYHLSLISSRHTTQFITSPKHKSLGRSLSVIVVSVTGWRRLPEMIFVVIIFSYEWRPSWW